MRKKRKHRHTRPTEREETKHAAVRASHSASSLQQFRISPEPVARDLGAAETHRLADPQKLIGNRAVQRLLAQRSGA